MDAKDLTNKISLLDYGYIKIVDKWGSEEQIIEAARMSTGKGFLGWGPFCTECGWGPGDHEAGCSQPDDTKPGDEKLLRFLWDNKHSTPFEMAGMTIEVQAPIFVFREWVRHRVPFGYNEMSGRYTQLPNMNYLPSIERLMMGSDGKNKQAGTITGSATLTEYEAEWFRIELAKSYKSSEHLYQQALKKGVPKELARVHLPVGRYSRMRVTSNLRGWLAFLTLRMAPNAQWEIRQYANATHTFLSELFPRTLALFDEGRV